jgi:hypothetical protein
VTGQQDHTAAGESQVDGGASERIGDTVIQLGGDSPGGCRANPTDAGRRSHRHRRRTAGRGGCVRMGDQLMAGTDMEVEMEEVPLGCTVPLAGMGAVVELDLIVPAIFVVGGRVARSAGACKWRKSHNAVTA